MLFLALLATTLHATALARQIPLARIAVQDDMPSADLASNHDIAVTPQGAESLLMDLAFPRARLDALPALTEEDLEVLKRALAPADAAAIVAAATTSGGLLAAASAAPAAAAAAAAQASALAAAQAPAVAPAAVTAAAAQALASLASAPTITTYYLPSSIAPGQTVMVPVVYTNVFSHAAEAVATPLSGSVGWGTINTADRATQTAFAAGGLAKQASASTTSDVARSAGHRIGSTGRGGRGDWSMMTVGLLIAVSVGMGIVG